MKLQDNVRSKGSAAKLKGRIYPLSIFISEKGNPWPYEAKMKVFQAREAAEDWLTRQAARYGVNLEFLQAGSFGYPDDVVTDCIPVSHGTAEEYYLWVVFLLEKIGWSDPRKLYEHMNASNHFDSFHVEIYSNTNGRAYSMPFQPGGDMYRNFVEGFISYRYYKNRNAIDPRTVAHEMLHLYGAWDLYQNHAVTAEQEKFAAMHFPDDIMHRYSDNIEELSVGPLTAWRVGWGEMREDWYEYFRPKNHRE